MTTFNEQLDELVRNSVRETTDKQPDRRWQEHTGCGRDFFQDNNPLGKKYTTTRIKSRKFLSNIAYVGINKEDFYNENSIFDVYLLVRKNLNPFSLDRKLADKKQAWDDLHALERVHAAKFLQTSPKKKTFCTLTLRTFCRQKFSK